MSTQDYSYIGVGQVYLQELGGTGGLLPIGNVSALGFAVTEETRELRDFTRGGGGTRNEVRRVQSVECSMTLHDLSPANLSRVLYGTTSALTAGAQTGVVLGTYQGPGTYLPFVGVMDPTVAPVINDGASPLVAGTDYNIAGNGILVTNTAPVGLAVGDTITANYTRKGTDVVQALTSSGKEYRLVFDGLNEALSGKRTMVDAFRVKLGAAQNLGLIGDEYAALEVTGKLLIDPTKTGAGLSQYFVAMMEQGALAEARAALAWWDPRLPAAQAIGAPELVAHLQGAMPLDEAIRAAQAASRQYAKRQRTWFRSRMRAWREIGLP